MIVNNQRSLRFQYHDWGETLEQGTKPPTAPQAPQHWLPAATGVCSWCVFTTVCEHLNGLNAEHKFRVWVSILDHTSFHFHSLIFSLLASDKMTFSLEKAILWMEDFEWWIEWSFYHLFDLSFLQNPFTAEDPLIRKWCNAKFLQICFRWINKPLDGLRVSTFSFLVWTILLFKSLVYKNTNWKKTTTLICWLLIVWLCFWKWLKLRLKSLL